MTDPNMRELLELARHLDGEFGLTVIPHFTADQMHAYLAAERARVEREVMPIIDRALPASLPEMAQLVDWRRTILRAIRGESS